MSGYFWATRQHRYSLTFALPLLLAYEGLVIFTSGMGENVRNGADVLMKSVFLWLGGETGLVVFGAVVVGVGVALVIRDFRRHGDGKPLRVSFMALMTVESVVYAAFLGVVVSTLTTVILHPPLALMQGGSFEKLPFLSQVTVSLGAGLYEELLFRVIVVSAFVGLGLWLRWKRSFATVVAVFASALVFSAFHYIGPYGDEWELTSFTFRAVAGVVLSTLYVMRGFGIAAWSHALYDVGLALLR